MLRKLRKRGTSTFIQNHGIIQFREQEEEEEGENEE